MTAEDVTKLRQRRRLYSSLPLDHQQARKHQHWHGVGLSAVGQYHEKCHVRRIARSAAGTAQAKGLGVVINLGQDVPRDDDFATTNGQHTMKLLLTSGGVRNASIHKALLDLLGKPIDECTALCIPTAGYGHPMGSPEGAWRFVAGRQSVCPMVELGWKSVGLLELSALPSIGAARWEPWVRGADALLVNGGDALYLAHWMRESGLAALLPSLEHTVWVGLSAGSMVMTPMVGEAFIETKPPITGEDRALGIVDFSIFPHLDHPGFDENTMACAERWATEIGGLAYAIDDQTAIQVVDGEVEVISEGNWRCFVG